MYGNNYKHYVAPENISSMIDQRDVGYEESVAIFVSMVIEQWNTTMAVRSLSPGR